ncbi:MAG: hypothetical protein WC428_02025 [Candidatus Paceibacterota bacterium]|jgi:hypothetical protein
MQTFIESFELQVDEKTNGAVIRINDIRGCRIRICGIPKELVFDEKGEVRSFIDITYPKQLNAYERTAKAIELMTDIAVKSKSAIITIAQKNPKKSKKK